MSEFEKLSLIHNNSEHQLFWKVPVGWKTKEIGKTVQ